MSRLKHTERDEAVKNAIRIIIFPRRDDIVKRMGVFAREMVIKYLLTQDEIDWLSTAPPTVRLYSISKIYFYPKWIDKIKQDYESTSFSRHGYDHLYFEKVDVPPRREYESRISFDETDITNIDKWQALRKEYDNLYNDYLKLKGTLESALKSCSTRKKVAENYPDLVQYLPEEEPVTKTLTLTNSDVQDVLKCASVGNCK